MVRSSRWSLVAAALMLGLGGASLAPMAQAGESVTMRPVREASPALRAFARHYIQSAAYWPDLDGYRSSRGRRFALERDILVGEADLDDSGGVTERFITIDNPLFCGRTGCTTYVLQKQGRGWRVVLQDDVRDPIQVLDETDGGYRRLCVARILEAWDGEQYQPIPSGRPPVMPVKATIAEDDLTPFVTCGGGDPESAG